MINFEEEKKKQGRPRKFNDPDELFEAGMKYINECIENKEPLTVTGLALALDTFKDVLLEYANGRYDDENKKFSLPVKRLKEIVENGYEKRLHANNPTGAIFALKNFGWRDEQYINQKNTNYDITPETENEIKKKYGIE